MSILTLYCNSTSSRDISKLIIRDDHFNIIENGLVEGKVSIRDCVWQADNIIKYSISLPMNSVVTLNYDDLSSAAESGMILLIVKAENSVIEEKNIINEKLYYTVDGGSNNPLGNLLVLSGTSNNRISGVYKFYNGTPNADPELIANATNDVTLDIIIAI